MFPTLSGNICVAKLWNGVKMKQLVIKLIKKFEKSF